VLHAGYLQFYLYKDDDWLTSSSTAAAAAGVVGLLCGHCGVS